MPTVVFLYIQNLNNDYIFVINVLPRMFIAVNKSYVMKYVNYCIHGNFVEYSLKHVTLI